MGIGQPDRKDEMSEEVACLDSMLHPPRYHDGTGLAWTDQDRCGILASLRSGRADRQVQFGPDQTGIVGTVRWRRTSASYDASNDSVLHPKSVLGYLESQASG